MHTRTIIAALAVAATGAFATSADASLTGTSFTATFSHTGPGWMVAGNGIVNHTYGGIPSIYANQFYGTFLVASPAVAPGYDNAILVDFSSFTYQTFLNQTGTISITGIDENVQAGSIAIFAGTVGSGTNIATNVSSGTDSFSASWSSTAIYTPPPLATPDAMVVAWNSVVPAPGALALLGVAGLVGARRRRRDTIQA